MNSLAKHVVDQVLHNKKPHLIFCWNGDEMFYIASALENSGVKVSKLSPAGMTNEEFRAEIMAFQRGITRVCLASRHFVTGINLRERKAEVLWMFQPFPEEYIQGIHRVRQN